MCLLCSNNMLAYIVNKGLVNKYLSLYSKQWTIIVTNMCPCIINKVPYSPTLYKSIQSAVNNACSNRCVCEWTSKNTYRQNLYLYSINNTWEQNACLYSREKKIKKTCQQYVCLHRKQPTMHANIMCLYSKQRTNVANNMCVYSKQSTMFANNICGYIVNNHQCLPTICLFT